MSSSLIIGITLSFVSALAFSFSNIFMKKGAIRDNVLSSIFLTMLASEFIVFLSSVVSGELFRIGSISPLALAVYALTGVAGFTVGRTLNYSSIVNVGPSTSSTIVSSRTIFALIFSIFLITDRITPIDIAGDLIVTLGILVVSLDRRSKKTFSLIYLLLPLGAATMIGLSDVLIRISGLLSNLPIDGTLIAYSIGLASYVPMQRGKLMAGIRTIPARSWQFLLLAGTSSGLAQVFRYTGLTYAPIFIAVPVIALTPIITVGFSYVALKDEKIGVKSSPASLLQFWVSSCSISARCEQQITCFPTVYASANWPALTCSVCPHSHFMIITGTFECEAIPCETLPMRRPRNPPRPLEPITMMSALSRSELSSRDSMIEMVPPRKFARMFTPSFSAAFRYGLRSF